MKTPPKSASSIVAQLKEANQDHEFYPTTNEIIDAMVSDIQLTGKRDYREVHSLLDIGAGMGF